jgi:DNA repair protein RadC
LIANTILLENFEKGNLLDTYEEKDILVFLLKISGCKSNPEITASVLLAEFGNLKNVLEARREQLMRINGIGTKTLSMLQVMVAFTRIWERLNMPILGKISNTSEAERYCKSLLLGSRIEQFYVICLNTKCNIIGQRKISDGSLSEVNAYPRIVMETALNYNASSVLLTHNHPGGTSTPSYEDITSTEKLQQVLYAVGILVLDHIIIFGDQAYSMIQHGDIQYRTRG